MLRRDFPSVRLIANEHNVGFARANNQSWCIAGGRYWMLLNSDAEVREGALDALVEFMDSHPRAGLASARLVSPDGSPQHCAQPEPSIAAILIEAARLHKFLTPSVRGRFFQGPYWNYCQSGRVGWTWGTALVARRKAIVECGALSDEFFMYGEDVEWCLRMRRGGWDVWFCAEAEVLHHGGKSPLPGSIGTNRLQTQLDGIYHAVTLHRGRRYTKILQAAVFLALAADWLRATLRGRGKEFLTPVLAYHRRRLTACS